MFNSSTQIPRSWQLLAKRAGRSVTSLFLSTGLAVAGLGIVPAYAQTLTQSTNSSDTARSATNNSRIADGIYLYGQSQVREQIGSAYMVFEVNQGQVVGAFYMPRSSFDCFYGTVESDQVALTVVDSYERNLHPYSVALETSAPIASAGSPLDAPVSLEGFQRIDTLSDNDQRILSACRADHQDQT